MRRIFIDGDLSDNITLTGQTAHHLKNVLRAKKGQFFTVVDSKSKLGKFEITDLSRGAIGARLVEELAPSIPTPKVILVQSICKESTRMEWIIQKSTELGVSEIYPVISNRTVVNLDEVRASNRRLRWQRIANSAAEQCGRDDLLKVAPISTLKTTLTENIDLNSSNTLFIFCYEEERDRSLKQNLRDELSNRKIDRVILLIGSEGGFEPEEAEFVKNLGGKSSSLGRIILRVDTAAISALSIIQYELGSLE